MLKHALMLVTVLMLTYLAPNAGAAESAKPEMKGHVADPVKDKDFLDKHLASYPLKTCVVTGKELGPTAVNYVYEGHLVRFCCPMCPAAFEKAPAKYLAMVDAAAKKEGEKKK